MTLWKTNSDVHTGSTIIGSDSQREAVQNCLHKILVDDLSNLPCSMRTALSMLTLLIPVCSDIPGKSVKRSVRVYKLACLDIHICKCSSRKCSFIVKGENPFRGENIWGLLQKHPHLHNIWVPLHEVIQLSYKRSPFRLIPKILARLEIFQSYCIVPSLSCALCTVHCAVALTGVPEI